MKIDGTPHHLWWTFLFPFCCMQLPDWALMPWCSRSTDWTFPTSQPPLQGATSESISKVSSLVSLNTSSQPRQLWVPHLAERPQLSQADAWMGEGEGWSWFCHCSMRIVEFARPISSLSSAQGRGLYWKSRDVQLKLEASFELRVWVPHSLSGLFPLDPWPLLCSSLPVQGQRLLLHHQERQLRRPWRSHGLWPQCPHWWVSSEVISASWTFLLLFFQGETVLDARCPMIFSAGPTEETWMLTLKEPSGTFLPCNSP